MATTTEVQAAGYIVADNETIWGYGETADAAWSHMLEEMRMNGIQVLDDGEEAEHELAATADADDFRIWPASAALLADVERRGGDIAWRRVGGVACTVAEEDGDH